MADSRRQSAAKMKRAAMAAREYLRNRKIAFWMVVFLVVVAAFVAGFLVRSNVPLVTSLGFVTEEAPASAASSNSAKPKTTYESLSMRISEVEDMLSAYSFDDVHLDEATDSMLAKLMESTGDPYAAYYDSERYEEHMLEDADRSFSGVGVLFGDYDGRAYAIDVLEGSEAQAEGVRQGDFVVAIDGDSSHQWSATEVIGALSRGDGESVVITWMRPISLDAKTGEDFVTTLTCRKYDVQNLTYQMVEGNVGYIKLRQITGNACDLVKGAVGDLAAQGALAYVLDITDNPGGYLTQSLDIASLFVQSGVLVGIETLDGTSTRAASGSTATMAPLVVVVNGYTSGVAEVLAAALQDNNRATTVGQTTTGKGSVQVIRELSFGGAVRYTAAYYLTPLGHSINGVGVVPTIEVANPDGAEENYQLQVAIDTARSLIGE